MQEMISVLLSRALPAEVQCFLSPRLLPEGVRFKVHSCLLALLPQQGLLLPDTPKPLPLSSRESRRGNLEPLGVPQPPSLPQLGTLYLSTSFFHV